MIDDDLFVRVQSFQDLSSLPVPEYHVTLSISARNEPSIWRETDRTGVTCDSMTCKSLLPVLLETVGRVDQNLIVERLSGKPFFCKEETGVSNIFSFAL
jgi:hypothetical protein